MTRSSIGVLIVDDSAVVRQTLESTLAQQRGIEVLGTASDPFIAAKKMRQRAPDVIILDVEMPRMDGLTFLQRIMSQHPIPVIVCSALTGEGAATTLRALELGAVEVIEKPKVGTRKFLEESRVRVADAVRAAANARLERLPRHSLQVEPKLSADAVLPPPVGQAMARTTDKVVVIGASTGGTEAVRYLLQSMPADIPGTVIVQHMPEQFTRAFAERLNDISAVTVKEAEDGDRVLTGRVLIAPGNRHTMIARSGALYHVEVTDGPLVCRHRPSVDVLFRSAARFAGSNAIGVLMTGMGDDGAHGLLEMRQAGAHTIAQDERTSVVYGMPAEAAKLGAAEEILPLGSIAGVVVERCRGE